MKRSRRLAAAAFLKAFLLAWAATPAAANLPPQPFLNGFETDTSGWIDSGGGTLTRQPSGFSTGAGGYADGVASGVGGFHARLALGTLDSCASGGGPQPLRSGPFTRWGEYSATFPPGGYRTSVAIYLDVPYATAHPDTRFDWSSAINDSSGGFRRGFTFNAGTDAAGFVISASNAETRCGVSPYDPTHGPVAVTQSGWYVLRHSFRDAAGVLAVDMTLIRCGSVCPQADEAGGTTVGTWTLSNPADLISGIGGNRYGWFPNNEFSQLAIDASERTGVTGALSVADGAVTEGDAAGNSVPLTVSLSAPAVGDERVDYSTADGSAQSPQDYSSSSGALSFEPGSTQATIQIPITGDALHEPDESFGVQLSNPRNATISDGDATVTILDDDTASAPPEDPKCRDFRRKLKSFHRDLAKAHAERKRAQIRRRIADTKERLKRLDC